MVSYHIVGSTLPHTKSIFCPASVIKTCVVLLTSNVCGQNVIALLSLKRLPFPEQS